MNASTSWLENLRYFQHEMGPLALPSYDLILRPMISDLWANIYLRIVWESMGATLSQGYNDLGKMMSITIRGT